MPIGLPAMAQPVRVTLATSEGAIVLELDTARAPITAGNFLRYVDQHRLDGTDFYRAMRTGRETGLIQGGVRERRFLLSPIPHEATEQTGLSHVDGAISMARFATTSFTFMFVWVPDPVCQMTSGN